MDVVAINDSFLQQEEEEEEEEEEEAGNQVRRVYTV
jgi:hypothetical protein